MVINIKDRLVNFQINFIRRLFPNYIISKSKEEIEKKNHNLAYKILIQTYKYHPNNYEINVMLKDLTLKVRNWKQAIKHLEFLVNRKITIDLCMNLAYCYSKTGLNKKHNNLIKEVIDIYPQHESLIIEHIDYLIKDKQWDSVYFIYQKLIKEDVILPIKHLLTLSMVAQIHGDNNYADYVLNEHVQEHAELVEFKEVGYRKLILFDNGETRIEFYKKVTPVNQIVVTFDSINMQWQEQPFSYQYLKRKNVDIMAVRKRKAKTYQQDLSQEDFVKTTEVILKKYSDKVAYGYSLGAYNALYYASLINCRIYSISPRLSIHSIYGRKPMMSKYQFKDNISLPYNNEISPIVVYDPKNKVDKRYIQNEVLKQFPKTNVIEVQYGGHAMAHHLLRTGHLKYFVDSVLEGKTPKYDKNLRIKSNIYFRRLSDECFEHKKYNWALNLINRSLEIEPNEILAIEIKVNILVTTHQINEALIFIQNIIKKNPEQLRYRILLIETYMKIGDLNQAFKSWEKAIDKFGLRPSLKRIQKSLQVD